MNTILDCMDNEWKTKIYFDISSISLLSRTFLKMDVSYPPVNEKFINDNRSEIPDWLIKFYSCFGAWGVKWKTRKDFPIKSEGTFEFIPLEQVLQDVWDDDFGGNSWASDMKGFRPLDLFYDSDGHVGFFVDRPDKKGLYLSENDGEAQPLHVDFEGYLKLLALSKGYGWWQNALVEISTGIHQPNTDSFRENMPKIFPEFSWEEFVALYQSVRIDK